MAGAYNNKPKRRKVDGKENRKGASNKNKNG